MATRPGEVAALSVSERAELDDLQRRGYGPGDGLSAAGAARLRALEERALDAQAPDAAEPSDRPRMSAAGMDTPSPSIEDGAGPAGLATDEDSQPAGLRHPVLRVLGAIVAGALLVGLGFALARPPESVDAGSLDRVPLDQREAAAVVGTAIFGVRDLDPDSLVQYASLGQGTPWSASGPDGRTCLILTVTDDSPEMIAAAGVWDVVCAPPGLPPIIDWAVDRSFPSPPQTLPEGSVVRLTLADERVRISIGRSG